MTQYSDEELLRDLNGGGHSDMPPFIDEAGAPAPDRDSQLLVSPHSAPARPMHQADAVHATVAGGSGYRVKVNGEYYAQDPSAAGTRGKVRKPYTAEFNVPRLEGCLSLIKNKLLRVALRKLHSDYVADRTCYIVEARPLDPATPKSQNLAYMDRGQLESFVRAARPAVPVDLATFTPDDAGTSALRASLIDYVQNPDPVKLDDKGRNTVAPGDPGTFLARERERQEQRVENAEIARLNPDLVA
jgi:hypothetical protein